MKLRYALILAIAAALLAACNFTLAADVTPPPGYVPPTPMPTLGPLFPPSAPDIEHGASIYAEKCAACHGATGLGDGEQGKQLPVTVAAFALPETAHKATPAQWFTTVTQGNMERFMPPFTGSLSEQDRWDVISYALTLHATSDQVAKGKAIFEQKCADCAKVFSDQKKMAALSEDDLVRIIKNGEGDVPAFGSGLSDADAYAVATYLRTLTFSSVEVAQAATSTSLSTSPTTAAVVPTVAAVSETPATTDSGTPSAEVTPVEGATQTEVPTEAPAVAGIGTVSGKIDNQTGAALPSDLKVTLHVYDHSGDPNAGPQEVATLDTTPAADGTYSFENIEIPANRIFISEVEQDGITYQSDFAAVKAGDTNVTLPDIKLFGTTTDLANLSVDVVSMHFNYDTADTIQVIMVYTMRNTGDKTIVVDLDPAKQEIPFIKAPTNASEMGFQVTQDSAPFYSTKAGNAFAMPPTTDKSYGLVAFTNLPASQKFEYSQQFVLPVGKVNVLTPQGVTVSGSNIADDGPTSMQGQTGQTVNFHAYSTGSVKAGETLKFTVSGKAKSTGGAASLSQNQVLLFGAGALGLALIIAGVWLYWRDRNRVEEEESDDDEFDDTDSVLDAIIALDDLHRAGKLSDEAYRTRRDELKAKLKE